MKPDPDPDPDPDPEQEREPPEHEAARHAVEELIASGEFDLVDDLDGGGPELIIDDDEPPANDPGPAPD